MRHKILALCCISFSLFFIVFTFITSPVWKQQIWKNKETRVLFFIFQFFITIYICFRLSPTSKLVEYIPADLHERYYIIFYSYFDSGSEKLVSFKFYRQSLHRNIRARTSPEIQINLHFTFFLTAVRRRIHVPRARLI